MQLVMRDRTRLAVLALLILTLPACATATRGSSTLFIVETTPVGAKVETTVPVKGTRKMTSYLRHRIVSGKTPKPDYTYRSCEPTPCGVEVPRRSEFQILVTKPGYEVQIHDIAFTHRDEIQNETDRNTAVAAGASATFGGAGLGSIAAAAGGSVGVAPVVIGAAVFALPVLIVDGVSSGVDERSGANYDIWPNPLGLVLKKSSAETQIKNREIEENFNRAREVMALTVPPTVMERHAERKRLKRAAKLKTFQRKREKRGLEDTEEEN